MKLLFSEHRSDYGNYIFPYAIWAIPDNGEKPSKFFKRGFLPSTKDLQRYYLCRHVRVALVDFEATSENRRIMRKCSNIGIRLSTIKEFDFTPEWRLFCKHYADIKFGKDVMTNERLNALMTSKVVSHLLLFSDRDSGEDVGLVTLYLEKESMAYYYYAFYDLNYYDRNLGMFMMTSAVNYFAEEGFKHIYLGTCYSRNAMYKTQFRGAEFFTGFGWSRNLKELKYLIERDKSPVTGHLLETSEYRDRFYEGDLDGIIEATKFQL